MNSTDHTAATVRNAKIGELVRFKIDGPVWVRGGYNSSDKTFSLHKFEDSNHSIEAKPTRKCFVGFTY